jgi:hypothetical protein
MWGTKLKPTKTVEGRTAEIVPAAAIIPDSDRIVNWCGKPIEPQFRHARDHDGLMLFVAAWRCSDCGKTIF